jgi:hypothetical protein
LFAILVSVVGVAGCVIALGVFVLAVAGNQLPWHPGMTVQEHYLEVGRSYTKGFVVGFFLCFFMMVGALGVSHFFERRRRRNRATGRRTADAQVA